MSEHTDNDGFTADSLADPVDGRQLDVIRHVADDVVDIDGL